MKSTNNIYILGGAGYLGLFLVHKLQNEYPDCKITIVTKNTTKEIFFRLPLVKVVKDTEGVTGEEMVVINLAYSIGDYFSDTELQNNSILSQIKNLVENNRVTNLIHVSSIVLSQKSDILEPSGICKEDTYYYAKSLIEKKLTGYVTKRNIPMVILRSGNIMGPGSPWVTTIIERLFAGKPLVGLNENYPSNSTFVGNLAYAIIKLSMQSPKSHLRVMNMCEFGDYSWKVWIDKINETFNYPVKKWNISELSEVQPGLKKDIKKLKEVVVKKSILILFKGVASNNLIIRIIDLLGLKNLKSKTKSSVRNSSGSQNVYLDLMEFNVARVYLNDVTRKTENLPDEILKSLPFTIDDAMCSVLNWCEQSGYSKLKNSKSEGYLFYKSTVDNG